MHEHGHCGCGCGGPRHEHEHHHHGHGDHRHGHHEHHGGHGEGCGCRRERGCCGGERCGERSEEREHGPEEEGRRGPGPDTRFMQLEMAQVLYGEAEEVAQDALRALLLDAAKARFRERFGDQITGLAQLAVDEMMTDLLANLDIAAKVEWRNEQRASTKDRLRAIFARRGEDEGGGSDKGQDG